MTASFFYRNLLFYIFICLTLSLSSEAAVVFLYHDCNPNTTTYTRNNPYRRNLNILLSSFQSNSTRQSGFYNLTVGQAPPDIVYGLFLCRGDVTKEICRECVRTASGQILQRCPNRKTALVYYDECTIRYSNSSFFSEWEQEPVLELLNTGNVSQPERFMQLLGNTMNEIATRAAKGDQLGKKYATQEVNFTAFQTLYTLAQCTPDLSVSDCQTCLTTAITYLPNCCLGKQGAELYLRAVMSDMNCTRFTDSQRNNCHRHHHRNQFFIPLQHWNLKGKTRTHQKL